MFCNSYFYVVIFTAGRLAVSAAVPLKIAQRAQRFYSIFVTRRIGLVSTAVSSFMLHFGRRRLLFWHISLRGMSRRRGRLHALTPCRSIQSVPTCRRQTEIERAQIVQRFSASCIGLPVLRHLECGPEELENDLDWCRYDKGGQGTTSAVDG